MDSIGDLDEKPIRECETVQHSRGGQFMSRRRYIVVNLSFHLQFPIILQEEDDYIIQDESELCFTVKWRRVSVGTDATTVSVGLGLG